MVEWENGHKDAHSASSAEKEFLIHQVWKKQKLYTIEEDEEGYQVVKRYKVNWKY